jgi:polyphosphate kinase 2 (PPK2 family)
MWSFYSESLSARVMGSIAENVQNGVGTGQPNFERLLKLIKDPHMLLKALIVGCGLS